MARTAAIVPTYPGPTISSTWMNGLVNDHLSQTDTTAQALASDLNFAAAKRLKADFIYFNPAAAPATTEGFIYYDSASHCFIYRDNAGWKTITTSADVSTHAGLTTGVHGVGGGTVAKTSDVSDHAALTTGVHGAGASTLATLADIAANNGAPGVYTFLVKINGADAEAYSSSGTLTYGGASDVGGVNGADHSAVIQAAFNNLTAGRTWKEKVVLIGDFDIITAIDLVSYLDVEIYGLLTLTAGVARNIFQGNTKTNIDFHWGIIDGNRANQTDSESGFLGCGVYLLNCSDCRIVNVDFKGHYQRSVCFRKSVRCHVVSCHSIDCGDIGFYMTFDGTGCVRCSFVDCTSIDDSVLTLDSGIGLNQAQYCSVIGNKVDANGTTHHAINLYNCQSCILADNHAYDALYNGIYLCNGTDYTIVNGNYCDSNGWNGIQCEADADNNLIYGNQCTGNGDQGVRIQDTTEAYNHVLCNDLRGNAGAYVDAGTSSKFAWNIVANGQFNTRLKEKYFAAYASTVDNSSLAYYGSILLVDAAVHYWEFNFKVPDDFVSAVGVYAIVRPQGTGNMVWAMYHRWGAAGEATTSNTGSCPGMVDAVTSGNVTVTANAQGQGTFDLSTLAKGDYVGLRFERTGNSGSDTVGADVDLIGVLFTYNGEY